MTGTVVAAILLGVVNLVIGVALGWCLRRANTWCPHCGSQLSCSGCNNHPTWSPAPMRSAEHSTR